MSEVADAYYVLVTVPPTALTALQWLLLAGIGMGFCLLILICYESAVAYWPITWQLKTGLCRKGQSAGS